MKYGNDNDEVVSEKRESCLVSFLVLYSTPFFPADESRKTSAVMLRNKQRLLFLASILSIITGILVNCIYNYYQEKVRVNLVVAILSSRYNFDQRDVIRKTWLNHSKTSHDLKWVPFFVVGNRDCHVPVSDRVSPFSCEGINITKSDLQSPSVASNFKTRRLKNRDCNPVVGLSFQVWMNIQGIRFSSHILFSKFKWNRWITNWNLFVSFIIPFVISIQVNSDIALTRVGCVFVKGKACKDIELIDVVSRKTIIKEKMNGNNSNNNNNNHKEKNEVDEAGVSSLTLNTPLLLPKGFTGLIISHYFEDNDLCSDLSLDLNDSNNTGLVSLLKVKDRSLSLVFLFLTKLEHWKKKRRAIPVIKYSHWLQMMIWKKIQEIKKWASQFNCNYTLMLCFPLFSFLFTFFISRFIFMNRSWMIILQRDFIEIVMIYTWYTLLLKLQVRNSRLFYCKYWWRT